MNIYHKSFYAVDFSWPEGEVKAATEYDPEWDYIVPEDSKGIIYYTNPLHTVTITIESYSRRRAVMKAKRYFNKIKANPTAFDCIFKEDKTLEIKDIQ